MLARHQRCSQPSSFDSLIALFCIQTLRILSNYFSLLSWYYLFQGKPFWFHTRKARWQFTLTKGIFSSDAPLKCFKWPQCSLVIGQLQFMKSDLCMICIHKLKIPTYRWHSKVWKDQKQSKVKLLERSFSTVLYQYQHSRGSLMMEHGELPIDHDRHLEFQAILDQELVCFHLRTQSLQSLEKCPRQWHYQMYLQRQDVGYMASYCRDGNYHVPISPKIKQGKSGNIFTDNNNFNKTRKTSLEESLGRNVSYKDRNLPTFVQGAVCRVSVWITWQESKKWRWSCTNLDTEISFQATDLK